MEKEYRRGRVSLDWKGMQRLEMDRFERYDPDISGSSCEKKN